LNNAGFINQKQPPLVLFHVSRNDASLGMGEGLMAGGALEVLAGIATMGHMVAAAHPASRQGHLIGAPG
jgi:hypothetical protein